MLIMERSNDLIQYFKYELTPEPTSLFKDEMMRKDNKASPLPSLVQPTYQYDDKDDESIPNIVIDGGYLLRKVVWSKDGTYNDILQRYLSYASKNFGLASIVFDGYSHLSTKDHGHKRRERSHPPCPDVHVKKDTQLQYSQSLFLTNNSNKTQLINLLSVALKEAGHIVKTSHDA